MIDLQKKVSCSAGHGSGEQGQGRRLDEGQGWAGMGFVMFLPKSLSTAVWMIWCPREWDPKYVLCGRAPGFAPAPALSFSHVRWQRQRRSELLARFSLARKTCHLALRRRFHLTLIVHYLYHVLGYHI